MIIRTLHPRRPVAVPPGQAAALAELARITAGRTDLLAKYAGQRLAWHDTGLTAAVHERVAQLCITAGADMTLIDRWSRQAAVTATRTGNYAAATEPGARLTAPGTT